MNEASLLASCEHHFTAEALSTSAGLTQAAEVLERATALPEPNEKDAWFELALAPYALDFDFELAGAQHALLQVAGTLLLKLRHPDTAGRLLTRLEAGVLRHDGDRYALYLIGLTGSPGLVPAVSDWFISRPVKSIAHYGFPLYRLMCDLLVRQQSEEVVEHVRQVLADHDARRRLLFKHHRYTYETALAAMTGGEEHRWQPGPIADPPPT